VLRKSGKTPTEDEGEAHPDDRGDLLTVNNAILIRIEGNFGHRSG